MHSLSPVELWLHIWVGCILLVGSQLFGAASSNSRCPFERLKLEGLKSKEVRLSLSQLKASAGDIEGALAVITKNNPSPGPEEVWNGLISVSSEGMDLSPVQKVNPEDQKIFYRSLQDRIREQSRSRKPMTTLTAIRHVHRAHLDLAREAEKRYQQTLQQFPEAHPEVIREKAYLEQVYKSLIERGTMLLSNAFQLESNDRMSVIDANAHAARGLMRVQGTLLEDIYKEGISGKILRGHLVHPDDQTPAGKFAAKLARQKPFPFLLVVDADIEGQAFWFDPPAVQINPKYLISGIDRPRFQIDIREGIKDVRQRNLGKTSGFGVTYIKNKEVHGTQAIFNSDAQLKKLSKMAAAAQTEKDRREMAYLAGGSAWRISDNVEQSRIHAKKSLEGMDRLRQAIRGYGMENVSIIAGRNESGMIFFAPTRVGGSLVKDLPQVMLQVDGVKTHSVGLFDLADGRVSMVMSFPVDMRGAISDLLDSVGNVKRGIELTTDQKLCLINVINKLKRRIEVHSELNEKFYRPAKEVSDFAMLYLLEPSQESYDVFFEQLKKYKGVEKSRLTLRESTNRNQEASPVMSKGFDGIPTSAYLKQKLSQAITSLNRKQRDSAVEAIAMEAVIHYVDWVGWKWKDRGGDNIGYDVEVENPNTGEKFFIEAKGIFEGNEKSDFRISSNELKSAKSPERAKNTIIAVVTVERDGSSRLYFAAKPDLGGVLGAEPFRPFTLGPFLEASEVTDLVPQGVQIIPSFMPAPNPSQIELLKQTMEWIERSTPEEFEEFQRLLHQSSNPEIEE